MFRLICIGVIVLRTLAGQEVTQENQSMEFEDKKQLEVLRGLKSIKGDLKLNYIDDLGALRKMTRIEGSLSIENANVQDLRPLSKLRTVGGTLYIDVERVRSLNGLQRLETVGGDLKICGSKRFPGKTIDVFRALRSVGGSLEITGCKPRGAGWVIGPFPKLTSIGGDLTISHYCGGRRRAPSLKIGGFPKLESVGGSIFLRFVHKAKPFPRLTQVGGPVRIDESPNLIWDKTFPRLKPRN